MGKIDNQAAEIGWLDRLAGRDTPLHRIDPRAKLITTLTFIVVVISYGKYQFAPLLPLTVYPLVLMVMGDVPARFMVRKLLIASPFAIFVGLFNPLLDHQPVLTIGHHTLSGGWVSYASILLRFALTVSATLAMVAGTGIHNVCRGLERLGVPSVFTVQVLMLYRYLFVLVSEGKRMAQARALRSVGNRGMGLRIYGDMLGGLLLRTLDRAQRVHAAMCCRGFDGHIRTTQPLRLRGNDILFTAGWLVLLIGLRVFDVAELLGTIMTGGRQ
jgi:cobalt/nickel transport system permease protein